MVRNAAADFMAIAKAAPQRVALQLPSGEVTYGDLLRRSNQIYEGLERRTSEARRIGLLGGRSADTFGALLALLRSGLTYVPLNLDWPAGKLLEVARAAELRLIIGDSIDCSAAARDLAQLIDQHGHGIDVVMLDDLCGRCAVTSSAPRRRSVPAAGYVDPAPSDLAYVIFTSGTTGGAKGVGITHANLEAYVETVSALYNFRVEDRFSLFSDISFDQSVHDMLLCWRTGATLAPVPRPDLLLPADFIRRNQITIWDSVPSVITSLHAFGQLPENAFPSLRFSFFGGEALSKTACERWLAAAPNSAVINSYGPTELTIACSHHVVPNLSSLQDVETATVPIGKIFAGTPHLVLDEKGASSSDGELCVGGPLVSPGYVQPGVGGDRFFDHPGLGRMYRTGDRVLRTPSGDLVYAGRGDTQVKVRGYRLELTEIEACISESLSGAPAVVVPISVSGDATFEALHAFVLAPGDKISAAELLAHCRAKLPTYMVPRRITVLDELPLTSTGKVDRAGLKARAEEGLGRHPGGRARPPATDRRQG